MNLSQLSILVISFLLLSVNVSAYFYTSYIPETYNTNQLYAGSYFKQSYPGSISGWSYNSYIPNNGYAAYGGVRYYPYGYLGGSTPVYNYSYPVYGAYPFYGAASYAYNYGGYGCGYPCYR